MTAEALLPILPGPESPEKMLAALVIADAIDCLRTVRNFLTQKKRR